MAFKMNPKSPALKSMGRYATPQAIKPAVTSPAKQMGVDAGETAAFEKSKAIEERADAKMQKAKGNKNRQAQIIKNTRKINYPSTKVDKPCIWAKIRKHLNDRVINITI